MKQDMMTYLEIMIESQFLYTPETESFVRKREIYKIVLYYSKQVRKLIMQKENVRLGFRKTTL